MKQFYFLAFFSLMNFEIIIAQIISPCAACNESLKQDVVTSVSYLYQQINYYDSIDQQAYDKMSTQAGGGLSFAGIGATANYNDFKEKLRIYKETTGYNSLLISSNDYASYRTNPLNYKYFIDCIRATCSNTAFLSYVTSETEDNLTLNLHYNYQGTGSSRLKVKLTITQNGSETTKFQTINSGADFPYNISRIYGLDGKSLIHVVVQPIDKDGVPIYSGGNFESKYFKPTINIINVANEYYFKSYSTVYSKDNLVAPDFEEHHCDDLENWCNRGKGYQSGDGKYAATPLTANLVADAGNYFEDHATLQNINFNAVEGPGASWNASSFNKDRCAVILSSTPTTIQVRFMGSASKWTRWQVFREQAKDNFNIIPTVFYYADKNTIQFSVPLNQLNNFKISLTSSSQGTFIINSSNLNLFEYNDTSGRRYFKIDLRKLLDPDTVLKTANYALMNLQPKLFKSNFLRPQK